MTDNPAGFIALGVTVVAYLIARMAGRLPSDPVREVVEKACGFIWRAGVALVLVFLYGTLLQAAGYLPPGSAASQDEPPCAAPGLPGC